MRGARRIVARVRRGKRLAFVRGAGSLLNAHTPLVSVGQGDYRVDLVEVPDVRPEPMGILPTDRDLIRPDISREMTDAAGCNEVSDQLDRLEHDAAPAGGAS